MRNFGNTVISGLVAAVEAVQHELSQTIAGAYRTAADAVSGIREWGSDVCDTVSGWISGALPFVALGGGWLLGGPISRLPYFEDGDVVFGNLRWDRDGGRLLSDPGIGRRLSGAAAKRLDKAALHNLRQNPSEEEEDLSLAAAAYDGGVPGVPPLGADWKQVSSETGALGGTAAVFVNERTKKLVVSFRGSETPMDWGQNGLNTAGVVTPEGRWAIDIAQKYQGRAQQSGMKLSFAGHSLGGSLASMASIATGSPARTFNAETIGSGNYNAARDANPGATSEAQNINYSTINDPLTRAQSLPIPQQNGTFLRPAAGAQVYVRSKKDGFGGHGLDAFDLDKPIMEEGP